MCWGASGYYPSRRRQRLCTHKGLAKVKVAQTDVGLLLGDDVLERLVGEDVELDVGRLVDRAVSLLLQEHSPHVFLHSASAYPCASDPLLGAHRP